MRRSAVLQILLICFLFLPLAAFAADLPALTGRVVDNANMIDAPTRAAITSKLEAFDQKTSAQVVVTTIESLDGEAIEPYANRLFRAWGLGQAGDDNGVLLLVARDDRKMRIEVGYGLEGTLTDLHSKLIIENAMLPAFRAGDFSGGISRAVDQIVMVLEGNAAEIVPPDYDPSQSDQRQDTFDSIDPIFAIFIFIWASLFVGGFAMAILVPIFGKKIGPNRYRWLGMVITLGGGSSSGGGGWSSGSSSGGWSSGSSGGGGFSGGGGSSGGGGASGSW